MADSKEEKKKRRQEEKARRKEEVKDLKVLFQYVIGVIIVMGGFVAGTIIGWSSPAAELLKKNGDIEPSQFAWISSVFALGAAFAQFIVMGLVKWLGLKWTIIITHVIVTIGWVILSVSYNFYVLVVGRLVCGMAGGFCVACPTYLGECAHKYHRGTLGVFFQLFITGGILYAYIFGMFKSLLLLNIACGAVAVAGVVLMIFIPESPYWLLKKSQHEKYDKVMKKFRGGNYNYSKEEAEMQASIDLKESVREGFQDSTNLKAFGVLLGLHVLQQLSGINAILYHAHSIFRASNTGISEDLSVIVIGITQVVLCVVAAILVDRSGRIWLFTLSVAIMCACLALTGFYFQAADDWKQKLAIVPTIALVVYIAGFSLGAGPLPWAMLGEYLTGNVKTLMSTLIAFFNWMLAFATSWVMPVLMANIPTYYIFYGFALVCLLGIFYLLLVVVETNQKTFEEIRNDIQNHKPGSVFRKRQAAQN